MLKVVGIIGYKNSGKTTLTQALARELAGRGHEVAVIKHTSHPLDLPGKDTAVLGETVSQVGLISPQESGVFWRKSLSLEDVIPYLEADIILVEGFKMEKTFPKIVCLRGEPDDRDLFDGLAICAVGPAEHVEGVGVPLFGRDEAGKVSDLVEQKAFKLPNLDCGGCGHERCYDMACEIVAGTGSIEACVSLQPATEVRIDGQPLPMNPFISSMVRGAIQGILSSLRGFKKGKIEVSI
ncbi:MAG: molybdopterin-guanine dinucleotide biosynthesis protein B [Anaerolineae bacterium]|nr:molybdopterin-guanine dinucleotide biosynthesis protein B [Anaerolineae bacterium]